MASSVTQVPDKPAYEQIIADSASTPTVLYLSSSVLPACRTFTPEYEALAQKHSDDEKSIRFCQIEYSNETSAMFQFSQAQLPVVIFMCAERWVKTLLSPKVKELEAGVEELKGKAEELRA